MSTRVRQAFGCTLRLSVVAWSPISPPIATFLLRMSNNMNTHNAKKTIAIVGGGHAGINIARRLSASLDPTKYDLVLINPRPYRIILPATLRMVVSDKNHLEETALVPYDKLFVNDNGRLLQDVVVVIRPGTDKARAGVLELQSGSTLAYDVLALATGNLWKGPIAFPDDPTQMKPFVDEYRAKFAQAKDIILVGGGAVGIELSGEIKDVWPDKHVTIVHRDYQLLNDAYPSKFRRALASSLAARGIDIVLHDVLIDAPDDGSATSGTLQTSNGKVLAADVVVQTVGGRPNTSFIALIGLGVLTEKGLVKVEPSFQLPGHPNIFAAGDIIDWKEQKQAAKATGHGALVAQNIISYLTGKPLKMYSGSKELIVVTNGKKGGVAYFDFLWGIVLGAWFAVLVKSHNLMLPLLRGQMGK